MQKSHPASRQKRAGNLLIIALDRLDAGVQFACPRWPGRRCRPDGRGAICFSRNPYISRRLRPVMNQVRMGLRPGGSSSSTEMSRFPVEQQAQCTGYGGWRSSPEDEGLFALPARIPRCRTPNRCCSSTMARPRFFELHCIGQHRMGAHHQPGPAIGDGSQCHPGARQPSCRPPAA